MRALLDKATKDFDTLAEGVTFVENTVPTQLRNMAKEAGASHVEVSLRRTDHTGPIREKIDDAIFLESALEFTAVGRPATAD